MECTTTGILSPVDRFFEFSLLGLLTSGYLAVVGSGYLDMPTMLLTAGAILFRLLMVSGVIRYQIPQKLVAALTLAYMGFYPIDYAYLSKSFLPATVHLVFFIAIVKILTATTERDFLLLKLIAFMELLAACVLSSSFSFVVYVALFLLLGVATFMSSEVRRASRKHPPLNVPTRGLAWRLSGVAGTVSIGMLLITAMLFFLLPRTARAALQHLLSHHYHVAGFSNEVSLGDIGELKKQDTPVMHVKLEPAFEAISSLRWRGAALSQFDGRKWFNRLQRGEILKPDEKGSFQLGPWRPWKGFLYTVHLNEAAPDGTLFFVGAPSSMLIEAHSLVRTTGESYRLLGAYSGLSYRVFSYLPPSPFELRDSLADPPLGLTDSERDLYLQVPHLDPRVALLAHEVTDSALTVDLKARSLEKFLRTKYSYTLELPKVEAADPLANFLFHRKKGHCEYFASSMAVMLRTINIPSRVVTGFAGGVMNPISGWYVVRASDAHSWVEAWLPRFGWTAFDPTPPDPNPPQISIFTRVGFYLDAAEVFWQDWILNYDVDRQLLLAARMQQRSRNLRTNWLDDFSSLAVRGFDSAYVYAPLIICAALFGFLIVRFGRDAWRWWGKHRNFRRVRRGEVQRSDATLLYERMLKSLKRRGIEKPPWLTPAEFARVVQDPKISMLVEDITFAYNELRFGGRPEAAAMMISLLSQLETV